jgi:hypothetical protein
VNEGRDILASNRDFIHFLESNKENNNIKIANELRINEMLF